MFTSRRFTPAFLLLTGFTISACTAILVPGQEVDTVERCNNTEDCTKLDDNRFVAQCVSPDGLDNNASSICAANFDTEIACGGDSFDGNHPLSKAYADALAAQAAYGMCSMENLGKRGCLPADGGCAEGLSVNETTGICDDPDDPIPAIYPPDVGGIEIAGQDAMDQFCRWYFCDETFVCDTSGQNPTCQPCSGKDPTEFGAGACGQIYIEGAPSPFYTSLDDANCSGDKPTTEAVFGPAPSI